jgi:glyoxylase-like metal-dependent hydrolase (beta-lactamase superfamily II)
VTTFGTAGHTPGHISIHISSGSEEMLLTGDVLVDSEVSFLHPEWPFGFDIDAPMGTKARMAFLDRAAADKTLVGLPATLPWLRARSARGEPLSLAAGRLAVNELMATSTSPSRQLQLQAKENSHEY